MPKWEGLKPEVSIGVGLAVVVLVVSIYQHAAPSYVDQRVGDVGDSHAKAAMKVADWTAAGAVAAVSLVTKDPAVFSFGALAVITMSWWHKHANMVNPLTGKVAVPQPAVTIGAADNEVDPSAAPDIAYQG